MKPATYGLVALMALAFAGPVRADMTGSWEVRDYRSNGKVSFKVRFRDGGRSSWTSSSSDVPLAGLRGLSADLAQRGVGDVRFEVSRDAGSLECAGRMSGGRGSGSCRFVADPSFVEALRASGYRAPSESDLLTCWIHDVSRTFLADLHSLGYRSLAADELINMKIQGVSPQYVRELGKLGYSPVPVDQLINMKIQGVSPEFVRRVLARSHTRPSASQLIEMKIMGADAAAPEAPRRHSRAM